MAFRVDSRIVAGLARVLQWAPSLQTPELVGRSGA
jgi:hypothetical protein